MLDDTKSAHTFWSKDLATLNVAPDVVLRKFEKCQLLMNYTTCQGSPFLDSLYQFDETETLSGLFCVVNLKHILT